MAAQDTKPEVSISKALRRLKWDIPVSVTPTATI